MSDEFDMPTLDDAREARQSAECVVSWLEEQLPACLPHQWVRRADHCQPPGGQL